MPKTEAKKKNENIDIRVEGADDDNIQRLGVIIGTYLPDVMKDRTNLVILRNELDRFVKEYYSRSPENRAEIVRQLTTAKLVIEEVFNRVVQQL